MKTLAVRAGRSASFAGTVKNLWSKFVSNSVTVASISAVVCYCGVILDSDITTATGAVVALIAVLTSEKKGGLK